MPQTDKEQKQEQNAEKKAKQERGKKWRETHPVGWNADVRHLEELAKDEDWSDYELNQALNNLNKSESEESESSATAAETGLETAEGASNEPPDLNEMTDDLVNYYGLTEEEAEVEASEFQEQVTGYDPAYWQDPSRVVRWYNALKAQPPGTVLPEWMTPEMQTYITEAYKYFEFRNNGAPTSEWKFLNPADQALPLLGELPPPPNSFLWENEQRFGTPEAGEGGEISPAYASAMVQSGQAMWTDVPDAIRAAILADPNFDIQAYDIATRQMILADPAFDWSKVPDWHKWEYSIQSNPIFQKILATPIAAAGARAGSSIGGIFGVPGKILGTIAGGTAAMGLALIGGEAYNPMGGWSDQPTWAAKAMYTFNVFAQTTEQVIGSIAQVSGVLSGETQEPGETREEAIARWWQMNSPETIFKDIWDQTNPTWAAANLSYEVQTLGTNFIRDISPFFSDDYYKGLQVIKDEYKRGGMTYKEYAKRVVDLMEEVKGPRAMPGQDFILGKAEPVSIMPDEWQPEEGKSISSDYVLAKYAEYIAGEVAKGRDIQEVKMEAFMWANQFASAFFKDFAGQMMLDPLNVMPKVEGKAMSEFLKRTSGDKVPFFEGGWVEPSKVTAEWKAATSQMPASAVKDLSPVARWLAGLNKEGEIKAGALGLYPSETMTRTTPQEGKSGWVRRLLTLAPAERARLGMTMAVDNLGTIATHLTPEEFNSFILAVQKMDLEQAKSIAGEVAGSAEFYTIIPMLKGFDLDALKIGMWDISAENRGLLLRIADILGKKPGKVVTDLGIQQGAARVYETIRQIAEKSKDQAAKTLLEEMDAGRFTVGDLETIGRTFNGTDGLPWHPAEFQAMALEAFKAHAEKWGADYFGVKPGSFAAQLAKTLKGVQSLLLLGYSPAYVINNVVNGEVTMAASGVYGLMSMKEIDAWTNRFGWTPERMRDSGLFGDVLGNEKAGAIADAMKSRGTMGKMQSAIHGASKYSLMPFAGKLEGMQGARAQTVAMKQMWSKIWERGRGFRKMDVTLERQLKGIDPMLPEIVYRAFEGGMNQKEIFDALKTRQTGVRARDLVTGAAQEMGMSTSQALTLLEQAGVMDALDNLLKNADSLDKRESVFNMVEKRAQDWIDMRQGQEVRAQAEHVRNRARAEGPNAVWEVVNDVFGKLNDRWIEHYMEAGEIADQVDAIPDEYQAQKSMLWSEWRRKSIPEWDRVNNYALSTWKGLVEGLGIQDRTSQQMFSVLGEQYQAWNEAYTYAMREYDAYHKTWEGKFTKDTIDARMTDLEALKGRIDEVFKRAFETERIKQEQFRDILVGQLRLAFGDQVAEVARKAYDQSIAFRQEMVGVVQKFRKQSENLYGADRRAAKAKFYKDTYLPRVIETRRIWEEGVAKVRQAINPKNGQAAPGTTPPPDALPPDALPPAPPQMGRAQFGEGGKTEAKPGTQEEMISKPVGETVPAEPGATYADEVWRIAAENGLAGLDENGNQVFGAKLDMIKFVKQWGGAEGGAIKRWVEITPDLLRKAIDSKRAWEAQQVDFTKQAADARKAVVDEAQAAAVKAGDAIPDEKTVMKAESEKLPDPSEKTEQAAAEAYDALAESERMTAERNANKTPEQIKKEKVTRDVMNLHIADLDPVVRDALQYAVSIMRDMVSGGEPGKRYHIGYGFDQEKFVIPSSYPDWYGPLKREKKAVLNALQALFEGKDKPETKLYSTLKAEALALLEVDPAMRENWAWAEALGMEGDILYRLDSELGQVQDQFMKHAAEGDVRGIEIMHDQVTRRMAAYPEEALSRKVQVVDDGKWVDGKETYKEFHDRLWNEVDSLYRQAMAEQINAEAELGMMDAETRGEVAMTREIMREQIIEAGRTPEQADAILEVLDAEARSMGPKFGMTPEEFFDRIYAGIATTDWGMSDLPQKLMQTVENYGQNRMSVEALKNILYKSGVKLDELKLMEFDKWVGKRENVTKAEALEWVRGKEKMLFQQDMGQGNKGAVTFLDEMQGIIYAFEASDLSTFVHEPAHIFLRQLQNWQQALPEHQAEIAKDWKAVENWTRVEETPPPAPSPKGEGERVWIAVNGEGKHSIRYADEMYIYRGSSGEEFAFGTMEEAQARLTQEMFARGFENYMRDGKAPTPALTRVFEMMKTWLVEIYKVVTGSQIDVNITPEIRGVFDRLLGAEPERIGLDQGTRIKNLEAVTGTDFFAGLREQAAHSQERLNQAGYDAGVDVYARLTEVNQTNLKELNDMRLGYRKQAREHLRGAEELRANDPGSERIAWHMEKAEEFAAMEKAVERRIQDVENGVTDQGMVGGLLPGMSEATGGMLFDVQPGSGHRTKMEAGGARSVLDAVPGKMANDANGAQISRGDAVRAGKYHYIVEGVNQRGQIVTTDGKLLAAGDVVMEARQDTLFQSALAEPANSEKFRAWFGESLVVDENGRPMIVYHGTTKDFQTFQHGVFRASDDGFYGKGFYFSPYPEMASDYAKRYDAKAFPDGKIGYQDEPRPGGNVMPVYLKLENPIKVWDMKPIKQRFGDKPAEQTANMKKAGYDGVLVMGQNNEITEIVAFDAEQIKSVHNRGTYDPNNPNMLFQAMDPNMPLGGMDQAAGFMPEGAILDETYAGQIKPLLQAMREQAKKQDGQQMEFTSLPPEAQAGLTQYVKQVTKNDMTQAKLATVRYGEGMRDWSMLNYNKKYGFDKAIEPAKPYQFWATRTGMNSALRILDRPAWFANYYRLQKFASRYERDLPDRLKGKIKIELPFLPEWTGGAIYVDPYKQLFPWMNFAQPFDQMRRDKSAQVYEAERVLQEWLADSEYSEGEIENAVTTQTGPIWEAALAEAAIRRKSEVSGPLDFLSLMMGPAWYLTAPAQAMGLEIPYINGQGKGPEGMSQLPITRTGQAMETATQGTWAEPLGNLVGLLAKPEQLIRQKLGLPEFGEYGEYYIDRQLANLVAEGLITVEEAQMAMTERSGEAYDQAVERVKMEQMLRVPTASAVYAGTHGGPLEFLKAIPTSILGGGILPEGELKYRGLREKWNAAWDAYDQGDTEAISKFFEDHPEYEIYLMKGKSPEERLRTVLIGQIWDSYMGLDKATRKMVTGQLGPLFVHSFLDSDTRSPDSLDVETLARWSMMLGNKVPETEATREEVNRPATEVPMLEGLPTETRTALNEYEQAKAETYPRIAELQNLYFSSSKEDRKRILMIYPELKSYWDWRRQYMEENPEVAPFLDSDVAKRIVSGKLDAEQFGLTQEQAKRLLGYYNAEFDIPVYTADYYLRTATPLLMEALSAHQLMGTELTEGAYKELHMIWESYGMPGDSFDDWLNNVIYATSGW